MVIVGVAAAFAGFDNVAAFEQAVYLGQQSLEPFPEDVTNEELAVQLAQLALADAGLGAGAGVSILVAGPPESSRLAALVAEQVQRPSLHLGLTDANISLCQLLDTASQLLRDTSPAVLIVALDWLERGSPRLRQGGVALVLAATGSAPKEGALAYASLDGWSAIRPGAPIELAAAGYVELSGHASGDDGALALRLSEVPGHGRDCGVGSIVGNSGRLGLLSGVASVIRVALALHHRYIPAAAAWTWSGAEAAIAGRFFVPSQSYPWFTPAGQPRRAAVLELEQDGSGCQLAIAETARRFRIAPAYEPIQPTFLLAVPGAKGSDLLAGLEDIERRVERGDDLVSLVNAGQEGWPGRRQADLLVSILGRTREELLQEIRAAYRGLHLALDAVGEWQTPRGSYFTAQPLGSLGTVAFVYPGAFSAYPGMARDVFRAFPGAHEVLSRLTSDPGHSFAESLIFPKTLSPLTARDVAGYESRLNADPISTTESGTACSAVYTHVLRDVVGLQPAASFGYSLGEISMLWSLGVWTEGDASRTRFRASPLFQTRLAGPQDAVRAYRAAAGYFDDEEDMWATYTLLAPAERVAAALRGFDLAFLTIVNGPQEVVVGGDPHQCLAVADELGCERVRMAFNYALHCPVTMSEMAEFVRVNTHATQALNDVVLYSADEYAPMVVERDVLAQATARVSCQRLDFPRLVERVYADGARIFIEVGPSGSCSRLVDTALAGRPHLALPIDRRGADVEMSLFRLVARLLSHGVRLDSTRLLAGAP